MCIRDRYPRRQPFRLVAHENGCACARPSYGGQRDATSGDRSGGGDAVAAQVDQKRLGCLIGDDRLSEDATAADAGRSRMERVACANGQQSGRAAGMGRPRQGSDVTGIDDVDGGQ